MRGAFGLRKICTLTIICSLMWSRRSCSDGFNIPFSFKAFLSGAVALFVNTPTLLFSINLPPSFVNSRSTEARSVILLTAYIDSVGGTPP